MHILFISHNYPPETNAAASRVSERAKYWTKWGHQVTVITCNPHFPQGKLHSGYRNKWYQSETLDGVRVIRVKTLIASNSGTSKRILSFLVFMVMATLASFRQKKVDVVAATSPQFFSAVAGWLISVFKWIPFVFELGDIWPASITAVGAMKKNLPIKILEKIELFLYRKAKRIIALTNSFKQNLIARGISEEKIDVVINGVELSFFKPQYIKPKHLVEQYSLNDKFIIGYIGTHGMAHALENIIEAATKVIDPSIHFLFVGDGSAKLKLQSLAQKQHLRNVTFIPAQAKSDIPSYWALCDLALVHLKDTPVFKEVIPSKIFEAMAMGKPILLAAPTGEASDIVDNNKVGFHIAPEQAQLLADTVEMMSKNSEQLNTFAKNSLEAAKRFSREVQARDALTTLSKCNEKIRCNIATR